MACQICGVVRCYSAKFYKLFNGWSEHVIGIKLVLITYKVLGHWFTDITKANKAYILFVSHLCYPKKNAVCSSMVASASYRRLSPLGYDSTA